MISGDTDKKIFTLNNKNQKILAEFLSDFRNSTLVGGCFDILHFGHIKFLRSAKKLGGKVVVLLESDEAIKKKKGRKPIHDQAKRAQLIASVIYVDAVISLPAMESDQEYEKLTKLIHPKYIAVTRGDRLIQKKRKYAEAVGAEVKEVAEYLKGLSTSLITKHASISSG